MTNVSTSDFPPRQVVLCDKSGNPTGAADALTAHTGNGLLHLAFSVYVFSPGYKQILIQQRSSQKMLWPLVWANTCCSHPGVAESAVAAGQRRLREELGIECELTLGSAFEYRASDPDGRGVEHEYDVLLIGTHFGDPTPVPAEVADWQWIQVDDLLAQMRDEPSRFTPWLHLGLPRVLAEIRGAA